MTTYFDDAFIPSAFTILNQDQRAKHAIALELFSAPSEARNNDQLPETIHLPPQEGKHAYI
jgi:hypothetical protein